MSAAPAPRAEASAAVRQDGREARVTLRAPALAVAGAPLELELVIENRSGAPLFVAAAASRAALRPANLAVSATLTAGGETVELDDPFAGVPEIGGPAGTVQVAPGDSWTQTLLLNELARLETAMDVLAPGARATLRVRVTRPLPLAATAAEAFAVEGAPALDLALEIELLRDDAALEAEVARIAGAAAGGVMAARQHAARVLAALRVPQAAPHLRALADDADAGVQLLARRGLAALPEKSPSGAAPPEIDPSSVDSSEVDSSAVDSTEVDSTEVDSSGDDSSGADPSAVDPSDTGPSRAGGAEESA